MMTGKKVRPWCALVQWPERKPFMVGTFFVEEGTRSREEILKLAEEQYKKEWGAVRYARKKFKRIYIIYPDGEIAVEN